MKRFLISLFCLYCSSIVDAQIYFNRIIDHNVPNESGIGIICDSGNFFSHYMVYSNGASNGYGLIKLDSLGNTIFDRFYPFVGYRAYSGVSGSFIKTLRGDMVGCGDLTDSLTGVSFGFIIIYNNQGDTLYTRLLSDSITLYNLESTSDSGFICTGSQLIGNSDIVAIKFDKNGNLEWTNHYGGSNDELAVSIKELTSGGYLISGTALGICGIKQHYLIKITSTGAFSWQKCYSADFSEGTIVLSNELQDGNFLIYGGRNYNNFIYYRPYLAKIDSADGSIIWEKEYGVPLTSISGFGSIGVCTDNTIFATVLDGTYSTIYKLSPQGDSLWRKDSIIPSSTAAGAFWSIAVVNENELIIAGQTKPTVGVLNVWIKKFDEWGCDTLGCEFLSVKENKKENSGISIYPNPSSDYACLEYDGEEGDSKLTIELFSIEGKIVYSQSANTSKKMFFIPLTDIPSGTYFVKASKNNEVLGTKKLVVVK